MKTVLSPRGSDHKHSQSLDHIMLSPSRCPSLDYPSISFAQSTRSQDENIISHHQQKGNVSSHQLKPKRHDENNAILSRCLPQPPPAPAAPPPPAGPTKSMPSAHNSRSLPQPTPSITPSPPPSPTTATKTQTKAVEMHRRMGL